MVLIRNRLIRVCVLLGVLFLVFGALTRQPNVFKGTPPKAASKKNPRPGVKAKKPDPPAPKKSVGRVSDEKFADLLDKSEWSEDDLAVLETHFGYDPGDVKAIQAETLLQLHRSPQNKIGKGYRDWAKTAFVQTAGNVEQLCHALVNFRRLGNANSRPRFVLLFTKAPVEELKDNSDEHRLILKLAAAGVEVEYAPALGANGFDAIHAFGLTDYDRVVYLGPKSLVMYNMDELFSLPDSVLTVPVDYAQFRDFDKIDAKLGDAVIMPIDRSTLVEEYYHANIEPEYRFKREYFQQKIYPSLPSMKGLISLMDTNKVPLVLESGLLVIHPDAKVFEKLFKAVSGSTGGKDRTLSKLINEQFNLMDRIKAHDNYFRINSNEFIPWIQLMPHNPYYLKSGEFRQLQRSHDCYLADALDLVDTSAKYPSQDDYDKTPIGTIDVDEDEDLDIDTPEIPYWSWYWSRQSSLYGWGGKQIKIEAKVLVFDEGSEESGSKLSESPAKKDDALMEKLSAEFKKKCEEQTSNARACGSENGVWLETYTEYWRSVKEEC